MSNVKLEQLEQEIELLKAKIAKLEKEVKKPKKKGK